MNLDFFVLLSEARERGVGERNERKKEINEKPEREREREKRERQSAMQETR